MSRRGSVPCQDFSREGARMILYHIVVLLLRRQKREST
jgi:hypothetical protein